jgi:hypothetical protein
MHNTFWTNAQKYAMPVRKNVRNMLRWEWNIASGVQRLAGIAPKLVAPV